jgi:threonine/homoserine/homoserine lactone efflux protein
MWEFLLVGLAGAFAVGPGLFNVYFSALEDELYPWSELSGFFAGELVYFILAMCSVRAGVAASGYFANALEVLGGAIMLLLAWSTLGSKRRLAPSSRRKGLGNTFLIVLSNPNIFLIDLTLVGESATIEGVHRSGALLLYWVGGIIGVSAVAWSIRLNRGVVVRWHGKLEALAAACLFFVGAELLVKGAPGLFGA